MLCPGNCFPQYSYIYYKLLVVTIPLLFNNCKPYVFLFALRPFYKFAFKIGFSKKNFFYIHVKFKDAVQNKILRIVKPLVNINGSYKRFKCISVHGGKFQVGIVCQGQ